MKKLLLFISTFALICCVSTQAQAQKSKLLQPSERERAVSLGISGTYNTATFTPSQFNEYNSFLNYFFGPGYGVGLFVNVPFAERFSFQGEVEYGRYRAFDFMRVIACGDGSGSGQSESFPGSGPSTNYIVSEAISVPLLIQYEFGKRRNMFLNFGPELRFNTKVFDKVYDRYDRQAYTIPYHSEAIVPVSLAFAVGFGMRVPVAMKVDFLWEVRLSSDLTSISRDTDLRWREGGFRDNEEFRRLNIAIKAGLAYRF